MCDINKTAKLSAIQGEIGVEITMVGDLQEMGIKYRQYVRDLLVGKKQLQWIEQDVPQAGKGYNIQEYRGLCQGASGRRCRSGL